MVGFRDHSSIFVFKLCNVCMFLIVITASSPCVRKDFCKLVCSNHFHMFSKVDLQKVVKTTAVVIFSPACNEDQK